MVGHTKTRPWQDERLLAECYLSAGAFGIAYALLVRLEPAVVGKAMNISRTEEFEYWALRAEAALRRARSPGPSSSESPQVKVNVQDLSEEATALIDALHIAATKIPLAASTRKRIAVLQRESQLRCRGNRAVPHKRAPSNHKPVAPVWSRFGILTHSEGYHRELAHASRIAGAGLPVLIQGETGTGKELLAAAIHTMSGRSGKLVAFNSARSRDEMVEAELFGHRKGAFTGAGHNREGLVRQAAGGTLFLDEVAELRPAAQGALLRFLDQGTVRPVGGDHELTVDTRVVAATHRPLVRRVRDGAFRADLYFRLAGTELHIPPLRARTEDILPLIRHFATHEGIDDAQMSCLLSDDLITRALTYPWPGNVRQLAFWVRQLVALWREGLDEKHLRTALERSLQAGLRCFPRDNGGARAARTASVVSRERLEAVLKKHRGNITRMADDLRTYRTQVYRWLRIHGLKVRDYRG